MGLGYRNEVHHCKCYISEQDHKAALKVQKVPVVFYTTLTEGAVTFMKFLTTYGYQFVAKQCVK